MSILTVVVRLPNYDFFPLELVLIPELTVFHVKGSIEESLCKHGHSGLSKVQMRLVNKGRELMDEELLLDCNIQEGSTLEIIVKMQLRCEEEEEKGHGGQGEDTGGVGGRRSTNNNNSTNHLPFDICEYRDFVRRVSPEDGESDVKVDASIQVIFGTSNIGLQICTRSLIDSSNWLPMHEQGSKNGDMVKQLGMAEAQRRGFVHWWSKQEEDFSHQRVFLLKLDTDTFSVPLISSSSSSASFCSTIDASSLAGVEEEEEGEEAAYRKKLKQVQRLHRLIDTKRYWWRGVNKGYSGGDFHSWQRYTKIPPIEVSISERIGTGVSMSFDSTLPLSAALRIDGEDGLIGNQHLNTSLAYTISDDHASCKCLTITPRFPLDYDATYVLLLANNVPTLPVADCEATWAAFAASVKVVGEDRLFVFHTQKLEAFDEEEEEA